MQKTSRKRVLFLNYEFPPLGGGAATANFNIFKQWSHNKDLFVRLITASAHSHRDRSFSDNIVITHIDVGKRNKGKLFQKISHIIVYTVKAFLIASEEAHDNEYDVCVAFFAIPSGVIALALKIMYGQPYIVSLRGSDVPGFNERFNTFYPFLKPIFRLVLKHADGVVTNSTDLRDLAYKTYDKKEIDIIPNGIDTTKFAPKKHKARSDKNLMFITTARLIQRKNVDKIIKAFHILDNPNTHLNIVGDGIEYQSLKRLVSELRLDEQVTFMGHIDRSEISKRLQASDVFILASDFEGMSNALLEAMATGLPIITTATGGVEDFLQDSCCILNSTSPEEISHAMKKLVENKRLRRIYGKRSRSIAHKLDWNEIANRYFRSIKVVALSAHKQPKYGYSTSNVHMDDLNIV